MIISSEQHSKSILHKTGRAEEDAVGEWTSVLIVLGTLEALCDNALYTLTLLSIKV